MTTTSIQFKKTIHSANWAEWTREALKRLGITYDRRKLAYEFEELAAAGFAGRLYVRPSSAEVPFAKLVEVANELRPKNTDKIWIWDPLWTPGTEKNSLTTAELDGQVAETTPQIAFYNADSTDCDPLLFALDTPFDDTYRPRGLDFTQVELIKTQCAAFTDVYQRPLTPSTARDYLFWVIQDCIRGVNLRSDEFVLNYGCMVDPTLGRHTVGGGPFVAVVGSYHGRARPGGWYGDASSDIGVSFSAGLGKA